MANKEHAATDETGARRDVVTVCHLMHQKGLISATDGNVSVRLGPDRLLTTPSGVHKGLIEAEQLIVTDMQGRVVAGDGRPTSEMPLHLAVYETRADVRAVIHAHPPIATAFSIAGVPLDECVIPEVVVALGAILTTEYASPSSPEGAEVVRRTIHECDALILARHGTVTVGEDVMRAYYKLEKVEYAAQVVLAARQLGTVQTLPRDEVAKLMELRKRFGLAGKVAPCRAADAAGPDRKTKRRGSE